jgi:hypothetical protein
MKNILYQFIVIRNVTTVSSVVMLRHGDINEPWTNRSLYFGIYSISNDLKVLALRTWAVSKFQLHCSSATVAYGIINVGNDGATTVFLVGGAF